MTVSNSKSIEDEATRLLHECDHEPDEVTKYVVIDQTEYVPKLLASIQEIIEGAKPERSGFDEFSGGFKNGVNAYEHNLKQALTNKEKE